MILSQQQAVQAHLTEVGKWIDLPESIGGRIHITFDFDKSQAKSAHQQKIYRKQKNLPKNADIPRADLEVIGHRAAFGTVVIGWDGQELEPGVPAPFTEANFLAFMAMPPFERALWAALSEEDEARKEAEAEVLGNSRGGASGSAAGAASPKSSGSTSEASSAAG
jgi:hypothetical protein